LISILIGSIGALYQIKIKRLLAYSAIANFGYIVLGLSSGSFFGLMSSCYYFIIYILISINIFIILLTIKRYPKLLEFKNIVEFVSITHSNFILSIIIIFSLFSLAGIPPLAGFYGKILIFFALISKGYYMLALYAVLFSVLTSVYYIS
jgi:NADH:ubiquinone oxidoreductase subunit 2 (subunit N)